jgi:hypothetical protein
LPALTGVPTLPGWKFLGYFDDFVAGKRYYKSNLAATVTTWDKVVPTHILYAQWEKELNSFWAQSNIYFEPDVG